MSEHRWVTTVWIQNYLQTPCPYLLSFYLSIIANSICKPFASIKWLHKQFSLWSVDKHAEYPNNDHIWPSSSGISDLSDWISICVRHLELSCRGGGRGVCLEVRCLHNIGRPTELQENYTKYIGRYLPWKWTISFRLYSSQQI